MAKKKYTRVKRKLGTFEQVSTVICVSDPCYDKDTWCAGTVKNVLPGTWTAYGSRRKTDDNWEQCRHLIAALSSYNGEEILETHGKQVDRKQLEENIALWKDKLKRLEADQDPDPAEPTRDWYEVCCDVSLSNYGAGVIRNGCLSGSGYGDGGYQTLVAKMQPVK